MGYWGVGEGGVGRWTGLFCVNMILLNKGAPMGIQGHGRKSKDDRVIVSVDIDCS